MSSILKLNRSLYLYYMRKLLFLLNFLFIASAYAQQPQAYALFDHSGKLTFYAAMMDSLSRADVVFFGEMHNCPITHWMEQNVLQTLVARFGKEVMVGAEMFESDNQLILDEYLQRRISGERFEAECRLWPNHSTDYAPLLSIAYDNHLPFIATNVPRRYANAVKEHGLTWLDSLSRASRAYLPPLPIYVERDSTAEKAFEVMGAMVQHSGKGHYVEAQALKDAAMAWSIAQNWQPNTHFIHFNGSYHTDFRKGIIEQLLRYCPQLRIALVTAVRQESVEALDEVQLGRSDFYICVPETMNTSY